MCSSVCCTVELILQAERSAGAGGRPEQCYYRLSLNQTSIRIHRQRERCSRRGERGVNPKHPRASANRRNAPEAKMVNQRLKDNSGQISEHQ